MDAGSVRDKAGCNRGADTSAASGNDNSRRFAHPNIMAAMPTLRGYFGFGVATFFLLTATFLVATFFVGVFFGVGSGFNARLKS